MTSDFYKRPLFIFLSLYVLVLAFFLRVPAPKTGDPLFEAAPYPQEISLKVLSYPSVRKDGVSFSALVSSIEGKAVRGKSYVFCKDCGEISLGDTLLVKGVAEPVFAQENYGSFNWRKYLARRHIFSKIKADEIISRGGVNVFRRIINKMRASMLKVFNDNFSPEQAAVLSGIALGEKGSVDKELYTAFQDSGAIHLLVASGGNVGFITLIVYFLCSFFLTGRLKPAFLALFAALLYTLLAGADAPLLRAYIMTLSSTVGFLIGRKSGVLQGLLLAAGAILIFNPQSIFDAGFQMSFLATLAIVYFACNFNFVKRLPKVAAWASGLFFVSLSAQLALLPLFTNYFNKVSFSAVISNIFLVPLSGVIMGGAFLLWAVSFIPCAFLMKVSVYALSYLLTAFNFLVEAFAAVSFAGVKTSAWSFWSIAAYYVALFVLFNFPLFKNKKLFIGIGGFLAFCFLLLGWLFPPSFTEVLEGRYSRSFLIKEKGKTVLIGAGVEGGIIKNAVLASGSKKIDCLFITSVYKSAAYALRDLEDIKISNIYVPQAPLAQELSALIEKSGADLYSLKPSEQICGVSAQEPWYGFGGARKGDLNHLSYAYKEYSFSADMKNYKKDGELILYN